MISNWNSELDPYLAPNLARSALLVIDTQEDFLDTGSAPIAGTIAVLPAIASLLDAYRRHELPIFHVIRLYEPPEVDLVRLRTIENGAKVVRPESPGAQIPKPLRVDVSPSLDAAALLRGAVLPIGTNEVVMWKPRWSAFFRTPLDAELRSREIDTVVVAGCNYPNCPRAAVYDASMRDYKVLVISDAISGLDERHLVELQSIGGVHAQYRAVLDALDNCS
jgi:nicotinamidase-related amidase